MQALPEAEILYLRSSNRRGPAAMSWTNRRRQPTHISQHDPCLTSVCSPIKGMPTTGLFPPLAGPLRLFRPMGTTGYSVSYTFQIHDRLPQRRAS